MELYSMPSSANYAELAGFVIGFGIGIGVRFLLYYRFDLTRSCWHIP